MIEAFSDIFNSGEIWSILIKVLLGIVLSGAATLLGTLIVKIITKNKDSKIYKYANTLVVAAEQKFPNEGTKMGPQKMDYVMGQLCIKFPKVKDNRYFYNIVEEAVFKFNDERQKEKQIQEFESKYGEGSYIIEQNNKNKNQKDGDISQKVDSSGGTTSVSTSVTNKSGSGLKSF